MDYKEILRYAKDQQQSMVQTLEILVNHESPSHNQERLNSLASVLANRFAGIGAATELILTGKKQHVQIIFPSFLPVSELKPVLVLGHFDTVWPVGTLAKRPFRVEQGMAYGPGAFDMKGGIVIIEYALRLIKELNLSLSRRVVVLLNSDEEIGSPHSRKFIKQQARKSEYVLVMEPAMPGGVLKTARKGVGAFTVDIQGRAAHAGAEPENGVNAIVELARQILHIQTFANHELGTTLNVGVVSGGTRSNVVPASAKMRIDGRAWTIEEAHRVESAFSQLKPFNPKIKLSVRGGFGRPPMERIPGTVKLYNATAEIGDKMGMTLVEGRTGGASDGNFCAALGIPTLDGLGVVGSGAHADHEQVEITSLPERAALVAGILCSV